MYIEGEHKKVTPVTFDIFVLYFNRTWWYSVYFIV